MHVSSFLFCRIVLYFYRIFVNLRKASEHNMKKYTGPAMLLLTAAIWGLAFVAQSAGMDYVGPFTFNAVRYLLGALVLIPFLLLRRRTHTDDCYRWHNPKLWICGIICGLITGGSSALQQIGLLYTTVGKSGFITALYVVLVPILGLLFGKRVKPLLWLCVGLAVMGLYFLCLSGTAALNIGDLLTLVCSVTYAFHILTVDHYAGQVDGVKVSFIQFLVAALISGVPMLALEHPTLPAITSAWLPLLYTGVLSCGVGYTFQILGQQRTEPTMACLILCLESVFSVLFGWLLLQQGLSLRELCGCALMLCAIALAQVSNDPQGFFSRFGRRRSKRASL